VGSYGYDWTIGGKKAELISFSEAMSRANDAEIKSVDVQGPSYSPYFYFQDEDKEHAVWFLDAVTFLNQVREVRDQKAGGFALYRLGSEDPAIWDALGVRQSDTTGTGTDKIDRHNSGRRRRRDCHC